jgi:hypothetical protein
MHSAQGKKPRVKGTDIQHAIRVKFIADVVKTYAFAKKPVVCTKVEYIGP